ncbi:MAG: hypothetical protein MJ195_00565 [Mycoplasmoidaceae bacterium]|nr:hypothetical protein [Mycoplasmoidaceae bacterium]
MKETENNKTIEEKAERKNFFNARNIIIIILTTLATGALMYVTFKFILDMD